MATATQVATFIQQIAPLAQEQAKKHDNKIFPSVCIAQACCESAFGTSAKMINANAVFGIKVGRTASRFGTAWKGAAYKTGTTEYYDGKNAVRITDHFRAYDSIADSVEDYFDLLTTASRYKYALNRPTPLECIEGIQKAPYATSPTYVRTIMSIITKYGLTKYDPGQKAADNRNPYEVPTRTIRRGHKTKNDVRWLQFELNRRGYGLIVDGIFGQQTEDAVRNYQNRQALVCDGVVGARTRGEQLAGK